MNLSDDEVSVSSLVSNEEQAPIAPKDNNEEDLYGSDDDDGVPPPPPPPEDDEESDDEQSIKSIDDEDNISEPDENSNMELLNYGSDYNESDEDSDDEDDNYLQKLDDLNKKNIIKEHHPDLLHHNHSEIEAFTRIVRNEKGNIVDPLHKTLPFITK